MILDSIVNLRQYESLFPGICAAADFLENLSDQIPVGKHQIIGDRVYAMVQRYETKPKESLLWECHNKYLDIQYIHSGSESILWSERNNVNEWESYNEAKDSMTSHDPHHSTALHLSAGQFAIFLPNDAHKPKCAIDFTMPVMKVVIKIAL